MNYYNRFITFICGISHRNQNANDKCECETNDLIAVKFNIYLKHKHAESALHLSSQRSTTMFQNESLLWALH